MYPKDKDYVRISIAAGSVRARHIIATFTLWKLSVEELERIRCQICERRVPNCRRGMMLGSDWVCENEMSKKIRHQRQVQALGQRQACHLF